jgi:hypothetical protein
MPSAHFDYISGRALCWFKSKALDQKSGITRFPIFILSISFFELFEAVLCSLFFVACYAVFIDVLRNLLRKE